MDTELVKRLTRSCEEKDEEIKRLRGEVARMKGLAEHFAAYHTIPWGIDNLGDIVPQDGRIVVENQNER